MTVVHELPPGHLWLEDAFHEVSNALKGPLPAGSGPVDSAKIADVHYSADVRAEFLIRTALADRELRAFIWPRKDGPPAQLGDFEKWRLDEDLCVGELSNVPGGPTSPSPGPYTGGEPVSLNAADFRTWFQESVRSDAPTLARLPEADAPEVGQPIYRTGAQGRPTSMHLVIPEAKRRIEAGEQPASLAKLADELSAWVQREHPLASAATAKTIRNNPEIAALYRSFKAASQKPS